VSRRHLARLALTVTAAALVLVSSLATAAAAPSSTPPTAPSAPPAAAPPAPAPVRSATPCRVTAKACMDLSGRQAWLTDGAGHITYGPVAARGGKKGAATPTGVFHVLYRDRNHWSRQFDAPMPNSVFFYPGDAFHADNPKVASNGCIHLTRKASAAFFGALRTGDEVQVVS
jgi:hypothetical protein